MDRASIQSKISWPAASSRKQSFSILDTIIYYITKNPTTPKLYNKLIQCCKYFFERNPVLVIFRISGGEPAQLCTQCDYLCYRNEQKCCVKVDIGKIKSKIWITCKFGPGDSNNLTTLICSKIYRCDDASFTMYFTETTIKEFKLWASFFQKFLLHAAKINNESGNILLLEDIIELIPDAKEFLYWFPENFTVATTSTIKNIFKLNINFRKLQLCNIPEIFAFEDLAALMMNYKNTKIRLHFNCNVSEQYKNQLDQMIDKIILSEIPNRFIDYRGQNSKKCDIMASRYTY